MLMKTRQANKNAFYQMIVIKRQNKTLQPKKLTKKTKKIAISRLTIS